MSAAAPAQAQEATLTFEGTVQRVGASTLAAAPASNRTLVVRVDRVLQAPAGITGLEGQEITVELPSKSTLNAQDRAVFYTVGWLYGESLAVRAVGVRKANRGAERQRGLAMANAEAKVDTAMKQRLSAANLVVVGEVTGIRQPAARAAAMADPSVSRPRSEHDPKLAEAEVQVREVLKGPAGQGTLVVPFPTSGDIMWEDVPKFQQGQEGVFVLHTDQPVPGLAADEPIALHPIDFQPMDQLARVRSLISQV
jgi:hypothetical protein